MPYPFSYFSSLFPFRKAFANRKRLSWFQMIFTSIFLISLSLIPVAIQSASRESQSLETFVERVYEPLTDQVMTDLATQGQLTADTFQYHGKNAVQDSKAGRVILGHQDSLNIDKRLTLYFDDKKLKIYRQKKELVSISYRGFQQADLANKKKLTAAISRSWFQENRIILSLFLTLGAGIIMGINFLILAIGATFILYLTKKSRLFAFKTIKECLNFTLNCLGLPVLISFVIGLLGQPLTTVITIQNILFVFYLVIVFYQTHYRDAENKGSIKVRKP
ncbi:maltodextrose utilization protein MalA [Streptococcus massiliensis]|uniref:Maltodextrose utilization protein MalA n=1 Tax=Streptococcus massiliensis TaxID=313439 RepID=A0A380L0V6_9STRE|nr:maltodextrose utilization protein MalA [Streptococcus massiliensis]